jgi:hypothetical protein
VVFGQVMPGVQIFRFHGANGKKMHENKKNFPNTAWEFEGSEM